MADDNVAQTSLSFDATGAKRGADEFKAAADKIIAANQGVETATRRVVTSTSAQTAALDRIAKSFDPFIAAAGRAQRQLETLIDIAAKGVMPGASSREIEQATRALNLMTEATNRLNVAQANQAAGFDVAARVGQLSAKFAPATASAQAMTAELAQLNQAVSLGVSIEGGYTAAWDKIVLKYDEGAQAAERLAAAQRELIEQTRAAEDAANSQQAFDRQLGVRTSPGSVGGSPVSPFNSAAASASVFQEQFDAEEKLLAENKRLMATYPSLAGATAAHQKVLDDLTLAVSRNLMTEQEAQVIRDKSAAGLANFGKATQNVGNQAWATRFATQQLGVQTIQFFSSIQAGQPILTAFIQQGHQVLDVAVSTGAGLGVLGVAARAVGGFLAGPGGLVVGGVAAVGALGLMALAAEHTAERIGKLRNELSVIRNDYGAASQAADDAARHLARTTPLSTADSRAGINSVFGQGSIFTGTPGQAEALVVLNAKISRGIGEIAINAARAGQIVADPAGVLATLLKEHPDIKAFDQQLVDDVKRLQEAGKAGEAFNRAFAALQDMTRNVTLATTPLIKAWQELEQALTGSGQGKRSLAESIGLPVLNGLTAFLNDLKATIEKIESMWDSMPQWLKDAATKPIPIPEWMSGVPSGGGPSAASLANITAPQTVAPPQYDVSQMASIVEKFITSGMKLDDAVAYAANAMRESGGDFKNLGDPQVPGGSHGLFQWNRERLANFRGQNGGLLPEQTSVDAQVAFVNWERTHGYAGVDAAAQNKTDLASKAAVITAGYESPANIARESARSAAIANDFMRQFNGGAAPMSGAVGGQSGDTTNNRVAEIAKPLADASTEAGRQELLTKKAQLEAALQLPNLDDAHFKEYGQALDDIRKKLEDAIPPSDALERSVRIQTDAEARIAAAWRDGASAAALVTDRVRAEGEARAHYATDSAQYAAFADRLTAAYHRLALAQTALALAEKSSQNADALKFLNAEISTLGMNANARELLLSHLKAELELRRQFPAATDAMIAKMVAESDQLTANAQKLRESEQALRELDSLASTTLDKFSNAITEPLKEGETAGQRFGSVMVSVFQDIEKELLKLAVINPILNSLGLGPHRSTLGDLASGLSGGGAGASPGAQGASGSSGSPSGLLGPIGSAIGKWLGGDSTGIGSAISDAYSGSWLQSIISPEAYGIASASSAFTASLGGGIAADAAPVGSTVGMALAGTFHQGGLVGFDAVPGRFIHPTYFDDLPRFHAGLGGDEFAAILQRGERVLTERQQGQVAAAASSGRGNGGHTINVHVQGPMNADTARRTGTQVGTAAAAAIGRESARNRV